MLTTEIESEFVSYCAGLKSGLSNRILELLEQNGTNLNNIELLDYFDPSLDQIEHDLREETFKETVKLLVLKSELVRLKFGRKFIKT